MIRKARKGMKGVATSGWEDMAVKNDILFRDMRYAGLEWRCRFDNGDAWKRGRVGLVAVARPRSR